MSNANSKAIHIAAIIAILDFFALRFSLRVELETACSSRVATPSRMPFSIFAPFSFLPKLQMMIVSPTLGGRVRCPKAEIQTKYFIPFAVAKPNPFSSFHCVTVALFVLGVRKPSVVGLFKCRKEFLAFFLEFHYAPVAIAYN